MDKQQNAEIAIFIDSENLDPALSDWILFAGTRLGAVVFICVYGKEAALKGWRASIDRYHLDTRQNGSEKNAADRQIQCDAWALFKECRVMNFVFATQDGDFAACIHKLRLEGCRVYGIGGPCVSPKLVKACTTYTIILESQYNQE